MKKEELKFQDSEESWLWMQIVIKKIDSDPLVISESLSQPYLAMADKAVMEFRKRSIKRTKIML